MSTCKLIASTPHKGMDEEKKYYFKFLSHLSKTKLLHLFNPCERQLISTFEVTRKMPYVCMRLNPSTTPTLLIPMGHCALSCSPWGICLGDPTLRSKPNLLLPTQLYHHQHHHQTLSVSISSHSTASLVPTDVSPQPPRLRPF